MGNKLLLSNHLYCEKCKMIFFGKLFRVYLMITQVQMMDIETKKNVSMIIDHGATGVLGIVEIVVTVIPKIFMIDIVEDFLIV